MDTKNLRLLTTFFLSGLLFISCSGESTTSELPPEIPPSESLEISFDGLKKKAGKISSEQTDSTINMARFTATSIKIALDGFYLGVPKYILESLEGKKSKYLGENFWEWKYTTENNDQGYAVRVTAQSDGEQTDWEFYILNNNSEENLFFSGVSYENGNHGRWTIYRVDSDILSATTTWEFQESSSAIQLNGYDSDGDEIISSVTYTFIDDVKRVVFHDLTDDSERIFQWNVSTGVGFYVSPSFNNGERSCWNQNFFDTSC